MIHLVLHYIALYLIIGLVTSFLVDLSIRASPDVKPYTTGEIAIVIILWPINVAIFVFMFISSFFKKS
jgi:hypothetical protein